MSKTVRRLFRITYCPKTNPFASPMTHDLHRAADIGWHNSRRPLHQACFLLRMLEVGDTVLDADGDSWERVQ